VIEKQNGQEEWFVVYDDKNPGRSINLVGNSMDIGKLVEVASDKNRTRGDLEIAISIRSVE
jgi:hypothetical protein